ncbi:AEP3 [Candida margitis]|uniref:AEP3 n=1 Tax=Candida margitis TaxID=1775924 RepID=UPI002225D20D|nr:AEP3 [Candida margitis]KAI5967518.1 AEP3 [Candida margitis]
MNALKETILRLTKPVPGHVLRPNTHPPAPLPRKASHTGTTTTALSTRSQNTITFANEAPSIPYPITYRRLPYQQLFREFLEPLDMPNLKTFNQEQYVSHHHQSNRQQNHHDKYDVADAKHNWTKRKSTNTQDQLEVYFENRQIFHKMLRFLVDITPPHLKHVQSETYKRHILTQELNSQLYSSNKLHNYGAIPNLPQPLTQQNFTNYIHDLVHVLHHWQRASKLSGIVPQILLDSHNLSNYKMAPFRSTTTYNHLMHYFGVLKNQSFLARALIVCMNRDGHGINTHTINVMIDIVRQQSRIRSRANSLALVLKYLHLANDAGVEINLTTWSRTYDIVISPYLKQQFLEEMEHQKIPIPDALYRKMIRDLDRM